MEQISASGNQEDTLASVSFLIEKKKLSWERRKAEMYSGQLRP